MCERTLRTKVLPLYRKTKLPPISPEENSPGSRRWIGSINAFLVVSGGLFAGQLYDRGHLYAIHLLQELIAR